MALQPEPQLPGSQQLSTPIRKGRLKRWGQLLWRSKTGTVGFFYRCCCHFSGSFC